MKKANLLSTLLLSFAATAAIWQIWPTQNNCRDYQLEITQDSIYLYDGSRLVKAVGWENNQLTTAIIADNE